LRITVLGCVSPYPWRGRPCPAYLVEGGGTKLLMDCGTGCLTRLDRYVQPHELDAVVLSHLHGDHMSDLLALHYAIDFRRKGKRVPLPVFAPPEPRDRFDLCSYKDIVEAHPISPGETLVVGELELDFQAAHHVVPTLAIRVRHAGVRLVYTADTGPPLEDLAQFAEGADMILAESTLRESDPDAPTGHLRAREAGELASMAGARRLALTHLLAGREPEGLDREAAAAFSGPVEICEPDKVMTIP